MWRPTSNAWRVLLAVCAAITVLPLWSGRYLPFTDLPEHVAVIAALRHWFDPSWRMQETFTLDLLHTSYSLYYLVGAALAVPLGSAERANTVLLSGIAVAFPYSLRALLRALGRDERLALFACPMFWSQSLLIGFFNYVAALPLGLWLLALVIKQLHEPTRRRALGLAAGTVALFFLHLSVLAFFVVAAAIAAMHVVGLRATPRRLAWLGPAGLLVVYSLATSSIVHPARVGWSEPRAVVFEPPDEALAHVSAATLDIWLGSIDEWCFVALVAATAWLAWPRKRNDGEDEARSRSTVASWLAVAAVIYLVFPQKIGWLWQLNERFALPFVLLFPLLLTPPPGWRGSVALVAVAAVSVVSAANAARSIRGFQAEVGEFDAVIARAAPAKRMLSLMFEQRSAIARFDPFLHFGAYYRARGGGVVAPSFAELPQSPLRYRDEARPPFHAYGWEWEPWRVRNDASQTYFDYILVRGPDPVQLDTPDGPKWHLVERDGRWALFARQ